jgi:cell fate regulator YaaT (PSP1 superfamily)
VDLVREYLLSYGTVGDFGRFRPVRPLVCRRGDRAVVRSHRGLELATVLCETAPGHAQFLPNTSVGEFLRLAGAEDEAAAARTRNQSRLLLEQAQALVKEQTLPLEVLDVEVLLDNQHAVVQYLGWGEFDPRRFVSRLSTQFELQIALQDLSSPQKPPEDAVGCGRPDCGKTEGGGCSSCGTGGGCSTCGSAEPEEVETYFAGLRTKMEQAPRMPLL